MGIAINSNLKNTINSLDFNGCCLKCNNKDIKINENFHLKNNRNFITQKDCNENKRSFNGSLIEEIKIRNINSLRSNSCVFKRTLEKIVRLQRHVKRYLERKRKAKRINYFTSDIYLKSTKRNKSNFKNSQIYISNKNIFNKNSDLSKSKSKSKLSTCLKNLSNIHNYLHINNMSNMRNSVLDNTINQSKIEGYGIKGDSVIIER